MARTPFPALGRSIFINESKSTKGAVEKPLSLALPTFGLAEKESLSPMFELEEKRRFPSAVGELVATRDVPV